MTLAAANRKLIFGCGYLGLRVARRWLAQGHSVTAVTRSEAKAEELAKLGITPLVADICRAETLLSLPPADTVLFAVGFDRSAGRSQSDVYVAGLHHVLNTLNTQMDPLGDKRVTTFTLRTFLYISSTGVFGQINGPLVDETSATHPLTEGGKASLAAEERLLSHPLGQKAIILRLAGIYGPDRIPRRADLEAGRPIDAAPEGYLNLIHVDDAADIAVAADRDNWPKPQRVIVADGEPVIRRAFYEELSRLANLPSPVFAEPTPGALPKRGSSDKRLLVDRLRSLYAQPLRYPDYRAGLEAILNGEDKP